MGTVADSLLLLNIDSLNIQKETQDPFTILSGLETAEP
jgi:hypothetical protein